MSNFPVLTAWETPNEVEPRKPSKVAEHPVLISTHHKPADTHNPGKTSCLRFFSLPRNPLPYLLVPLAAPF